MWSHVIADSIVSLGYFSIVLLLVALTAAGRRRSLVFGLAVTIGPVFFTCGIGHALKAVTPFVPLYRLEGVHTWLTAVAAWIGVLWIARHADRIGRMISPTPLDLRLEEIDRDILKRFADSVVERRRKKP